MLIGTFYQKDFGEEAKESQQIGDNVIEPIYIKNNLNKLI
jgi:hypothetical protein